MGLSTFNTLIRLITLVLFKSSNYLRPNFLTTLQIIEKKERILVTITRHIKTAKLSQKQIKPIKLYIKISHVDQTYQKLESVYYLSMPVMFSFETIIFVG